MASARSGILIVLSAPSGAGKSTLIQRVRADGEFVYSVSCTTRPPRPGEKDGEAYWFLAEEDFRRRVQDGFFLEYAKVHGHFYGTSIAFVKEQLAAGRDLLLDLDVQGAAQIRACPDPSVQRALATVFLTTPTFAELERRLRTRATDSEETIRRRLRNAAGEMAHWREYDYAILSGTPEKDARAFRAVADAERHRVSRIHPSSIWS
ncbi:MAG: guanylate kinase [Verrucomicrobiae bacterium]|nr:guanylate kinase [Verrucomicrobiae bacterium]